MHNQWPPLQRKYLAETWHQILHVTYYDIIPQWATAVIDVFSYRVLTEILCEAGGPHRTGLDNLQQPTDHWHIFLICIHRRSRPKPISLQPLPKFLHEPAVPADVAAYLLPWWVGGWWGGCCWAQAVESARQLSHHHHTTPSWNFTEHPTMWYIYLRPPVRCPWIQSSACQRSV